MWAVKESSTANYMGFPSNLCFGAISVFPVHKVVVEGNAVFEERTFLLLCSSVGGCCLSDVLDFYHLVELVFNCSVSLVQIQLSPLQPLLQLVTSGGRRPGAKVLPAGFSCCCHRWWLSQNVGLRLYKGRGMGEKFPLGKLTEYFHAVIRELPVLKVLLWVSQLRFNPGQEIH